MADFDLYAFIVEFELGYLVFIFEYAARTQGEIVQGSDDSIIEFIVVEFRIE